MCWKKERRAGKDNIGEKGIYIEGSKRKKTSAEKEVSA